MPANPENKLNRRCRRDDAKTALRGQMLQAAASLFLSQGYGQFSLRQVAERVGYSPGNLYRYFKNKDDLLFAAIDEGFIHFTEMLATAFEKSDDPWERILHLGDAYTAFALENPDYYQLMFVHRIDYLMQTPVGENTPRIASFAILENAVQTAISAKCINPLYTQETACDILWSALHGVVSLAIVMPTFTPERTQALLSGMKRTLTQALCTAL